MALGSIVTNTQKNNGTYMASQKIKQRRNSKQKLGFRTVLSLVLLAFLFVPKLAMALKLEETNYLASIKANEANIRSGPGVNYPIKFTYNIRNIPVRVVSEYDNWNEIEDFEGERGWINQGLLSSTKTIIVRTSKSFVNLYSAANDKSQILLKLEDKVITKLLGCKKLWCKVELSGKKGWLEQKDIWPKQS